MAIKKNIATDFKIPAEFWKANNLILNYEGMKAISTANGYFSQELMDDPVAKFALQSTVEVNAYWYREHLENAKPKKTEELVTLEKKQTLTDDELKRKNELEDQYQETLVSWEKMHPYIIIEEHQDLWDAILTLIKYQTQFHMTIGELAGGEYIPDKLPERPIITK